MPVGVALMVGGCGTFVPEIQEFPGDAGDGQALVQAIVTNITCEVQNAVNFVIRTDMEDAKRFHQPRNAAWLDNWGVQLTLNLTIDEKTSGNPTVSWLPPSPASAVFNLDAGVAGSVTATRTDKVSSFFTVQELVKMGPCDPADRKGGLFLLQSDLKLREWLVYNTMLGGSGTVRFPTDTSGPIKQDVISHEVKFEVVTSGNVTPGWKLTRVSVNQGGTFLTAGRTRSHDLLITFGPTDAAPKGKKPSITATNSHLAAEIGLAVANGIRSSAP